MKLAAPANANYAATVVAITAVNPLEGCDAIVGTPLFGYQAIVGKDTQVGDIGIVFSAETQLSGSFAHHNNLHRHGNLNADQSKKGFLEDNGRVKAIKLRGHRSDALFMPLSSLDWTGADVADLKVGDTFDVLNGQPICKKYEVKRSATSHAKTHAVRDKVFSRVDEKFLPRHFDTDNFFKNRHLIKPGTQVTLTQKLHGTSIRIGNTLVARKLSRLERIAAKLGVKVAPTGYDMVYGSRSVIKDANNPYQKHFYGEDIWTEEGKRLDGILPQGFIVFGELIGWSKAGAPIQKNYTYQVPQGTAELYVYRVAQVSPQGRLTDLAWVQVKQFCKELGLKHVPEVYSGSIDDLVIEDYLDVKYSTFFHDQVVPLAKESPCDEGVCVRVDGLTPLVLKAKSPRFLQHETKMLDQEAVDIEAEAA